MFLYVQMSLFSFLLLCSVLVYDRYTNVNIGPQWVGTQLKVFLNTKHTIEITMKCKLESFTPPKIEASVSPETTVVMGT